MQEVPGTFALESFTLTLEMGFSLREIGKGAGSMEEAVEGTNSGKKPGSNFTLDHLSLRSSKMRAVISEMRSAG